MSLSENDKRVLRLVKVGAENSITGAEISLITKLTERTVRDIIKRLVVKHNIPIVGVRCGIFSGYFIPANKGELLDGAKAFYNQVQEESKRLAVLMNSDLESYKETLKEVGGYV
ncbi:DNA-binding protein [Streptococcus pseudopneumoniae]|uniref:DNA-binding protein n=1 Tax=Streptococcus pseudopneumoniae TaxID=257758 RepID=UPI0039EFBD9A